MTNYREILRLHSLGLNKTEIAASLSCSRNTVAGTLRRADECGLKYPLPESMSDINDIFYKQALAMFDFSEVNGIGLGYAKGESGAGFGKELAEKVISTAYEIVKAGVVDPEFLNYFLFFKRMSDRIVCQI